MLLRGRHLHFSDKARPARLIIKLLFGFASDSVFDKLNQSTNGETMWQCCPAAATKCQKLDDDGMDVSWSRSSREKG